MSTCCAIAAPRARARLLRRVECASGRASTSTDTACQMAKAEGVLVSLNSDAHDTGEFANLRYGIGQARRVGSNAPMFSIRARYRSCYPCSSATASAGPSHASSRRTPADALMPTRTMPWHSDYFPTSMKHLPPLVREKAIEIANALLDEGMEEGKAIRIAIAKAKEWAKRRRRLEPSLLPSQVYRRPRFWPVRRPAIAGSP